MSKSEVAKRYAVAIYEIAKKMGKIEETKEFLKLLMIKCESDKDFMKFIENPLITLEEKEILIVKTFDLVDEDILRVAFYIVKKGRTSSINEIKEKFIELMYEAEKKLPVVAIFAKRINEEQEKKLICNLEKKYNKKIELTLEIDEEIIGGGIIKVGNNIINGSIKHQIENMKRLF